MHSFLEHAHPTANQLRGHRLPGLQPDVLEDVQRAGVDPRLLPQPDNRMEVPLDAQGADADGAHLPRALPLDESMRLEYRHRSR